MKYADIIWNDIVAGEGLCVSFYTQGCPHHCKGCHNPQTWHPLGGRDFPADLLNTIIERLNAQGIQRPFCILGGEPLCADNLFLVNLLIRTIREKSPHTPIYIWTGYTMEELLSTNVHHLQYILENTDYIIDGRYMEEYRDLTLPMRGSSNQRIFKFDKKEKKWYNQENEKEEFYL